MTEKRMRWYKEYNLADSNRLREDELRQDLELLLGQELGIERLPHHIVIRGTAGQQPTELDDGASRSVIHLLLQLHGVEVSWPVELPRAARPIVVLQCATDTEYAQLEVALRKIDASKSDSKSDFIRWETDFATIIAARPYYMGVVDSALLTTRLIDELTPDALFMIGIAAGLDYRSQRFGDLLVAASSHDLFYGKWKDSDRDGLNLRTDQRQAKARIREALLVKLRSKSETKDIRENVFQNAPGSRPEMQAPNIEVGAMACVPSVIDSKSLLDQLIQTNVAPRHCIGLEMEIFGIYRAIELRPRWQGTCVAIKAISDFAFEKDAHGARDYAAYVSAAFVLALLAEKWPVTGGF